MKSNKIVFTITVLILFLAIAVVWSVQEIRKQEEQKREIAQSQDQEEYIDTSDWKVYKNEEYRFEMRYPQEWTYQEAVTKNEIVSFGEIECATKYGGSTVHSCYSAVGISKKDFTEDFKCNMDYQKSPYLVFDSDSRYADCSNFGGTWLYFWYKQINDKQELNIFLRYADGRTKPNNNKLYWDWIKSGKPTKYYDYQSLPNLDIERKIVESYRLIEE